MAMQIPKNISDRLLNNFKNWLILNGGLEEMPITNQWELFRFRYAKGTLILYRNQQGECNPNHEDLHKAWDCFKSNRPFPWKQKSINRPSNNKNKKKRLQRRDGDKCFYCIEPMDFTPGSQMKNAATVEHLLELNFGGNNRMENQVLACLKCNARAGGMSIIQKIHLRDSSINKSGNSE